MYVTGASSYTAIRHRCRKKELFLVLIMHGLTSASVCLLAGVHRQDFPRVGGGVAYPLFASRRENNIGKQVGEDLNMVNQYLLLTSVIF